jgi:DNA-binding response OmpR family regulator
MPHLLLVDDDEDLLSLLTNFFRKHAHTVSTAADGPAMFAVLEKHPIDLVILDVMLQNEDGFSLCSRLRAASAVPVIMLTAMADHTDRVVGLEKRDRSLVRRAYRAASVDRRRPRHLCTPATQAYRTSALLPPGAQAQRANSGSSANHRPAHLEPNSP